MKNEIKLSDLAESVKNLASEFGQDCYSVSVDFDTYTGIRLKGYIQGLNFATGNTIAEVIKDLREQKNPELKKSLIEDVVI